jgi:hypothetical protein
MTSNLALGLAFNCFLPVLLPTYVLSAGGSATDVWVAMAMAGLFALLGPSIGRLAGQHRAHRLAQVLGMLGMAGGLVALGISNGDPLSVVLAIAVMGISAAAVAIAAPSFILGSDLDPDVQARQLTWLQLNLDLGKIVGGLLLVVMVATKLPIHAQFRVGGLALGGLGLLVWLTNGRAASRIDRPGPALTTANMPPGNAVPWRTLLLSLFGVPVVAQLVGSTTMIEAQTSIMLTISGMVGIGLYFLAGRWMGRSGPGLVWATGHALRGAGGLALGVLGFLRGVPYLVVLAAFLVLESAPAIAWLAQARAAARAGSQAAAPFPASTPACRPSVPAGHLYQRQPHRVPAPEAVVSAAPSPVLSRPA